LVVLDSAGYIANTTKPILLDSLYIQLENERIFSPYFITTHYRSENIRLVVLDSAGYIANTTKSILLDSLIYSWKMKEFFLHILLCKINLKLTTLTNYKQKTKFLEKIDNIYQMKYMKT
jgi:hypothetical protein